MKWDILRSRDTLLRSEVGECNDCFNRVSVGAYIIYGKFTDVIPMYTDSRCGNVNRICFEV